MSAGGPLHGHAPCLLYRHYSKGIVTHIRLTLFSYDFLIERIQGEIMKKNIVFIVTALLLVAGASEAFARGGGGGGGGMNRASGTASQQQNQHRYQYQNRNGNGGGNGSGERKQYRKGDGQGQDGSPNAEMPKDYREPPAY
jgi:hypothetical protein